jgi:hypothetical protein
VLVVNDTGDRKDGSASTHVARQYLGSVGKTDNGIICVTSLWADGIWIWPIFRDAPRPPASGSEQLSPCGAMEIDDLTGAVACRQAGDQTSRLRGVKVAWPPSGTAGGPEGGQHRS